MTTLYALKPKFQAMLRPLVGALAGAGVTANQVTVVAALLSVVAGAGIAIASDSRELFWLLPAVLLVRMGLNAVDGMLAREHGQASPLGAYLNELADQVSDLALVLPFAMLPMFPAWGVAAFAAAALLAEYAGVMAPLAGARRNYAGPFGKSDRALAIGVLAALVAIGLDLSVLAAFLFPLMAILALATAANRVHAGLAEIAANAPKE